MLISKNPKVISVYEGTPIEEINAIPRLVEELKEIGKRSEKKSEEEEYQATYMGESQKRVQEIGERLDKAGGYGLMLWAAQQMPKKSQHELECVWDGIGDWQF